MASLEEGECMRVIVRARPKVEAQSGDENSICIDETGKKVSLSRDRKGVSEFSFSEVLGGNSSQDDLYRVCKSSVDDVLQGINCCILAYGQTGSGKTYSLLGGGWDDPSAEDNASNDPMFYGVIPRCLNDIFDQIEKRSGCNESFNFNITSQFMQIYNEKIYDLQQDKRRANPLQLRDIKPYLGGDTNNNINNNASANMNGMYIPPNSVYVQGLSEFKIYNKEDVILLLKNGLKNRVVRSTEMNTDSSRSHTIVQMNIELSYVENTDMGNEGGSGTEYSTGGIGAGTGGGRAIIQRSIFRFVDLAGSEKWKHHITASNNGNIQPELQKEMLNINTSLHVLGNCISALIETNRKHIPYRNSILTRIISDTLGGIGKNILISTIRLDDVYKEETYSTLQFASRASKIKTIVRHDHNEYDQLANTAAGVNGSSANLGQLLDQARREVLSLRMKLQIERMRNQQLAREPLESKGEDTRPIVEVDKAAFGSLPPTESDSGDGSKHQVACLQCEEMKSLLQMAHDRIMQLEIEVKELRQTYQEGSVRETHNNKFEGLSVSGVSLPQLYPLNSSRGNTPNSTTSGGIPRSKSHAGVSTLNAVTTKKKKKNKEVSKPTQLDIGNGSTALKSDTKKSNRSKLPGIVQSHGSTQGQTGQLEQAGFVIPRSHSPASAWKAIQEFEGVQQSDDSDVEDDKNKSEYGKCHGLQQSDEEENDVYNNDDGDDGDDGDDDGYDGGRRGTTSDVNCVEYRENDIGNNAGESVGNQKCDLFRSDIKINTGEFSTADNFHHDLYSSRNLGVKTKSPPSQQVSETPLRHRTSVNSGSNAPPIEFVPSPILSTYYEHRDNSALFGEKLMSTNSSIAVNNDGERHVSNKSGVLGARAGAGARGGVDLGGGDEPLDRSMFLRSLPGKSTQNSQSSAAISQRISPVKQYPSTITGPDKFDNFTNTIISGQSSAMNSLRYSQHILAGTTSYIASNSAQSSVSVSVAVEGAKGRGVEVCVKHGLEACVLCKMFGDGFRGLSNDAPDATPSNNKYKPTMSSGVYHVMGISSLVSDEKKSSDRLEDITHSSKLCSSHSVMDCLLCTIRSNTGTNTFQQAIVPNNNSKGGHEAHARSVSSIPAALTGNSLPIYSAAELSPLQSNVMSNSTYKTQYLHHLGPAPVYDTPVSSVLMESTNSHFSVSSDDGHMYKSSGGGGVSSNYSSAPAIMHNSSHNANGKYNQSIEGNGLHLNNLSNTAATRYKNNDVPTVDSVESRNHGFGYGLAYDPRNSQAIHSDKMADDNSIKGNKKLALVVNETSRDVKVHKQHVDDTNSQPSVSHHSHIRGSHVRKQTHTHINDKDDEDDVEKLHSKLFPNINRQRVTNINSNITSTHTSNHEGTSSNAGAHPYKPPSIVYEDDSDYYRVNNDHKALPAQATHASSVNNASYAAGPMADATVRQNPKGSSKSGGHAQGQKLKKSHKKHKVSAATVNAYK